MFTYIFESEYVFGWKLFMCVNNNLGFRILFSETNKKKKKEESNCVSNGWDLRVMCCIQLVVEKDISDKMIAKAWWTPAFEKHQRSKCGKYIWLVLYTYFNFLQSVWRIHYTCAVLNNTWLATTVKVMVKRSLAS